MNFVRPLAVLLLVTLCACSPAQQPWHMTDVSGALPRLEFKATRANDGQRVSQDDYKGRVAILYFGYTHCPDICPTTLANLAQMVGHLGTQAYDVRILFVTVDPDRDTPDILKSYVQSFGPEVHGLRLTPNALAAMARRYRVAYGVTPATPGHPYQVMHSSAVFFFDRAGRARLVATSTNDIAGITEDTKRLLDQM